MKMPSRQTLAKLIFVTFVIFFIALIALYLYNPFSSNDNSTPDPLDSEKRGSIFAPFGNFFSNNDEEITRPETENPDENNQENPDEKEIVDRLRQVTQSPTAAAIFYLDEEEISQTDNDLSNPNNENLEAYKKNTIRYVLKENGHVYQTTSDSTNVTRVSITTIPKIAEAFFITPLTLVYRYLDGENIKTFSAEIIDNPNGTEGQKVQGIFLPDNIIDFGINIAGNFLYSEKTTDGSSFVTTNYLGENKTRVFSSPLSELNIDFKSKGRTALVYAKPSSDSYGRVFTVNTETGASSLIASGQRALAGLGNSNMSKVALSSKQGDRHVLQIRDNETGELYNTGLETLVDKCVWSLDNVNLYCGVPEEGIASDSPDSWYKGVSSYSDLLWVINTQTRAFGLLMSPVELAEEEIDMTNVNLSSDEQFIHFINKKDLTLWSYKLN
jgi:hypothetical protein